MAPRLLSVLPVRDASFAIRQTSFAHGSIRRGVRRLHPLPVVVAARFVGSGRRLVLGLALLFARPHKAVSCSPSVGRHHWESTAATGRQPPRVLLLRWPRVAARRPRTSTRHSLNNPDTLR